MDSFSMIFKVNSWWKTEEEFIIFLSNQSFWYYERIYIPFFCLFKIEPRNSCDILAQFHQFANFFRRSVK